MQMNYPLRKIRKSEKGQGLVEFALAITLLLFMLAGTIDLGRAFFTYMAMRDAAQEGASFAIINAMNGTAIEQRAKTTTTPAGGFSGALAVNLNIDEVEVLTQVTGDPCAGSPVTVTVTYDEFPLFFPFSNILFGKNSIPLSTSVTDTILLPACE